MRTKAVALGTSVVLLAAAGGGGYWWQRQEAERDKDDAARALVDGLASGWTAGDVDSPTIRFDDPATREQFATTFAGLGSATVKAAVTRFERAGDEATAVVRVAWRLSDTQTWTYEVPVDAAYDGTVWTIDTPASGSFWVSDIKAGDTVELTRTSGTRGDLLDRDAHPLMPEGDVYPVALDPTRATPETASALEGLVGEKKGSLVARLATATKAGSKAPIAVITYRQSDFDRFRERLDALRGVVYPRTKQPLAPYRTFGQPLLGSYGEVTAEVIEKSNGRYAAGDRAGLSGLQGQYDATLAGTPGLTVTSSTGKVLFEQAAVDGADVSTMLDPAVQEQAEKALALTRDVPSALVAVDVRTGDVLAAANSPSNGFDRAVTGQYPPGSTFKVATTYTLLTAGKVTPEQPVSCPRTQVVDGRSFRNFEGETLGSPTFRDDFAHSCNTAFIQLADGLGDNDLTEGAKALGIGADWAGQVGVDDAFAGAVPANNGQTDKAAAAIGQGRVLTSPLALAAMAGNVARGRAIAPVIVAQEGVDRAEEPLDDAAVRTLRSLMRQVVTGGTGSRLQGVAGGAVSGKTGTAEYGTEVPPKNRAWFMGWQGDIAFAVLVEDGVSGGTVAAPVARQFLAGLAGE